MPEVKSDIPLNDEITWHRPIRPSYSDMEGPGIGYCAAFVVIPVVMVVIAAILGWI